MEHGAAHSNHHHHDIQQVEALLEPIFDGHVQATHAKYKEQYV